MTTLTTTAMVQTKVHPTEGHGRELRRPGRVPVHRRAVDAHGVEPLSATAALTTSAAATVADTTPMWEWIDEAAATFSN